MKITKVTQATVYYVETDSDEPNNFIRHSASNWTMQISGSNEDVSPAEDMEQLFQSYIKQSVDEVINDVVSEGIVCCSSCEAKELLSTCVITCFDCYNNATGELD